MFISPFFYTNLGAVCTVLMVIYFFIKGTIDNIYFRCDSSAVPPAPDSSNFVPDIPILIPVPVPYLFWNRLFCSDCYTFLSSKDNKYYRCDSSAVPPAPDSSHLVPDIPDSPIQGQFHCKLRRNVLKKNSPKSF